MDEVLISVQSVGKKFCRNLKKSLWYGLCDATNSVVRGQDFRSEVLRNDEFWAVEDVSFEVRRGECIGLIGKNGAGKTTILKMLNGLILPDRGKIEMRGRVGGLIALGAGFNPLLTGRENVFVNGAILGLSRREIDARMDEIAAFADIGVFMDAPVQSYSSGMSVRLGFAIAAVLMKPDILLLDEVLAVGDMGFMIKCLNAVREMASSSAVVFVSHSMQFVSAFCSHALVLSRGRVLDRSPSVGAAIQTYMACFETPVGISGTGEARVENVQITTHGESPAEIAGITQIRHGADMELHFDLLLESGHADTILTITILDIGLSGAMDFPEVPHTWNTRNSGRCQSRLHLPLGPIELNGGRYSFMICLTDRTSGRCLGRYQGLKPFVIQADAVYWGTVVRQLTTTTSSPALSDHD